LVSRVTGFPPTVMFRVSFVSPTDMVSVFDVLKTCHTLHRFYVYHPGAFEVMFGICLL
jgi:hypothetical protein